MKAPSPQLGCGLIFPDCCIFKSSFRAADPEQARSVISGFQKTRNLDKACYGEYSDCEEDIYKYFFLIF